MLALVCCLSVALVVACVGWYMERRDHVKAVERMGRLQGMWNAADNELHDLAAVVATQFPDEFADKVTAIMRIGKYGLPRDASTSPPITSATRGERP